MQCQGEFGLSLRQGAKVSRLIAERFPATLELATMAAVLALALGHSDGRVFGACAAARS
jgi:ABC-type dipeptide/oligopeptide/nickel transport system permease component